MDWECVGKMFARMQKNVVISDAALPTAIPPKLRSHKRANSN